VVAISEHNKRNRLLKLLKICGRGSPHQCSGAWHVHVKCCRNQVSVSGFKRSFEDGKAGEGGRGKNFADVVP
jgi:hypothetical protein